MAAYRHFADKEDLLHAISEAGFAQFADALETARDSAPASFAARMDRMAVAYLRFAFEHPAHYEVMFSSAMKPEDNEAEPGEQAARAFAVLEKTIQEAQLSGEIRREDSATLARIVWALVHGISMLRLEADTSDQGAGTKLALFASEVIRTGLELRPRPVYTPGLTA